MKALVYHGPGEKAWEEKADPAIAAPSDVIVRIDSSTICGTDLHILKGDVPEVQPGTILGHEAVGTVVETGGAVTTLAEGDRVLVSCITSCGRCRFCKEGHYGLCTGGGGWIFGHLIDGLQAEYARVPFAETSVHKVPEDLADEQVLSSRTSCRRPTRWASSTGRSTRATRWSWSERGRSALRR
jgi:alcohol dehydrogenase